MENPLSVRANAFAIASIMSDPEAAAEYAAYGYCAGAPAQHQLPAATSSVSAQCRMSATAAASGGGDCQYQNDWNMHHHHHHHHQQQQQPADVNGYGGGLKAMEGP